MSRFHPRLKHEGYHAPVFFRYEVDRDIAAAKIIEQRGQKAVGQPVQEKRDNAVLGRGCFLRFPQEFISPVVSPMSDCRKKACGLGRRGGITFVVSS